MESTRQSSSGTGTPPAPARRSLLGWALWTVPAALLLLLGGLLAIALRAPPRAEPPPPRGEGGEFPRTIVEAGGKRVVIPAKPLRIVPANVGSADILAALVEPPRIAALPRQVDGYGAAREFFRQHKGIPRFEHYNAEVMLALAPDLVLVSEQNPAVTSMLESRGVAVLDFEMFRTFEGIRGSILALGSAVGEDGRALQLAVDFDRRLAAVEKAVSNRFKPRVLAYSNYGTGYAVGTGESQDEIIRRAGGLNAAAEMNLSGHVPFSFEQMLKLDPDWIAVSGDDGLASPQAQVLFNERTFSGLAAIRNRRIAVIPERCFSSISHYVADAVEILSAQLHPASGAKPSD